MFFDELLKNEAYNKIILKNMRNNNKLIKWLMVFKFKISLKLIKQQLKSGLKDMFKNGVISYGL
jgi:hypothetical protein